MSMDDIFDHFGDIFIDSEVENSPYYYKDEDWWADSYTGKVPYISCYASKFSKDGKLGLILINKHGEKNMDIEFVVKSIQGEMPCDSLILGLGEDP